MFISWLYGLRADLKKFLINLRNPLCRNFWEIADHYRKFPRYQPAVIKFSEMTLATGDVASLLSTYKEIFVDKIYNFKADSAAPVILDWGANIGLSMIFFRKLYPQSEIWGYEADPEIFNILQQNWTQNNCDNGKGCLCNYAVYDRDGEISFCGDHADGGHINAAGNAIATQIKTLDARKIMTNFKRIDLLKIDIEGAEEVVIPAIATELHRVEKIFLEYHRPKNSKGNLAQIMSILESAGFRIQLQSIGHQKLSPFISVDDKENSFDLQLNIWGSRSH